jgi:predicted regulator of Ras-like GTPase activity (Roadblock/LC7/MglB family)
MFDRLKNLFSKRRSDASGRPSSGPAAGTANAKTVTGATLRPPALPRPQMPDPMTAGPSPGGNESGEPSKALTGHFVRLALRPIILALPAALKARVRQPPSGNAQITVSVDRVLPQLGTGSAKITFGELRQAAPAGIFADLSDQDQAPVELSLNDILSQLPPELLPRRGGQKRIEVPDEVTPIFGPKGEPLTNVRMIKETGRSQTAAAPAVTPAPSTPVPPPRSPAPPSPASRPPVTAPPPPARPSAPIPAPALPPSPSGPIKPGSPLPSPAALRPPASPPPSPPSPTIPGRSAHPLYGQKPGGLPQQPAQIPTAPAPPAKTPVSQEPFVVPLKSLINSLPEQVRQAISADAVLALPGESVEQGLKRGKVAFTWSELRPMISPALAATMASEINETVVELPLQVIAPLFLSRKKPSAAQKKYDVGEDIPDVFQGRGLSPAVTAAAAAPPPAEAPLPEPVAATPTSLPKDIGEVFGQPGRKNWTPIEVVQRTSSLNGVAGALIAMQDGLLVAGQLPPGLNGETIAAFIPQMYTRMMQYCKELKFNDATNITVLVDSVPLKIYKAGTVYFTVLGRDRDSLPEPHLTIVAAHLEPQSK